MGITHIGTFDEFVMAMTHVIKNIGTCGKLNEMIATFNGYIATIVNCSINTTYTKISIRIFDPFVHASPTKSL